MSNDKKPRLWLVDDEFNEIYLRTMRPRIEDEGIEFRICAGRGMLQEFMLQYPKQRDLKRDFMLLDVFMGVPGLLQNKKYWGEYEPNTDSQGAGFALANWLHLDEKVEFERIRVASSHTNYSLICNKFHLGNLYCYENWHSIHPIDLRAWMGDIFKRNNRD